MSRHERFREMLARRPELSAAEEARLQDHLSTCVECRESATAYTRQAILLRSLDSVEPPPALRAWVLTSIQQQNASPPSRRPFWVLAPLAAALVVALGALSFLNRPYHPAQTAMSHSTPAVQSTPVLPTPQPQTTAKAPPSTHAPAARRTAPRRPIAPHTRHITRTQPQPAQQYVPAPGQQYTQAPSLPASSEGAPQVIPAPVVSQLLPTPVARRQGGAPVSASKAVPAAPSRPSAPPRSSTPSSPSPNPTQLPTQPPARATSPQPAVAIDKGPPEFLTAPQPPSPQPPPPASAPPAPSPAPGSPPPTPGPVYQVSTPGSNPVLVPVTPTTPIP